jgi:hypothetical protein
MTRIILAFESLTQNDAARTGMQQVADAEGRLAGGFPTALAAVPTLGWKGRHHRVLGDIHWSHADTAAAIAAFEAGRAEAEQHGAVGERAMMQVRLALAHQLLDGLDQCSNTLLAQVVALIRDAGTGDVTARAESLRTDSEAAGSLAPPVRGACTRLTTPPAVRTRTWPPPSAGSARSPPPATSPTSPTSPTSWLAHLCQAPPPPGGSAVSRLFATAGTASSMIAGVTSAGSSRRLCCVGESLLDDAAVLAATAVVQLVQDVGEDGHGLGLGMRDLVRDDTARCRMTCRTPASITCPTW